MTVSMKCSKIFQADGCSDFWLIKTQWISTSRWHCFPKYCRPWKVQSDWIQGLSTISPDSRTLISNWNVKCTHLKTRLQTSISLSLKHIHHKIIEKKVWKKWHRMLMYVTILLFDLNYWIKAFPNILDYWDVRVKPSLLNTASFPAVCKCIISTSHACPLVSLCTFLLLGLMRSLVEMVDFDLQRSGSAVLLCFHILSAPLAQWKWESEGINERGTTDRWQMWGGKRMKRE